MATKLLFLLSVHVQGIYLDSNLKNKAAVTLHVGLMKNISSLQHYTASSSLTSQADSAENTILSIHNASKQVTDMIRSHSSDFFNCRQRQYIKNVQCSPLEISAYTGLSPGTHRYFLLNVDHICSKRTVTERSGALCFMLLESSLPIITCT